MKLVIVDPPLAEVLPDPAQRRIWWQRLETARADLIVEFAEDQNDLAARIGQADAVAGHIGEAACANATERLNWVHSFAAGPQNQLFPEFLRLGVTLTCSKGNGAVPLAEHAMLMILALARNLPSYLAAQSGARWERHLNMELAGKTCAILGAGYSATELARRARAFGMRVTGLKRDPRPLPDFDEVIGAAELRRFLEGADVLVNTLPLTPRTWAMIGARELAWLRPSALYVCVSRGGIVEDDALVDALRNGRLAGAGLDAHTEEPLPRDSPYWGLLNTIVTPHDAAHCAGTHERGLEILIDNLRRYGREELRNVVDVAAGY